MVPVNVRGLQAPGCREATVVVSLGGGVAAVVPLVADDSQGSGAPGAGSN
jgi:hypothetical protein